VAADIGHAECTFLVNMARSFSDWPFCTKLGLKEVQLQAASFSSFSFSAVELPHVANQARCGAKS